MKEDNNENDVTEKQKEEIIDTTFYFIAYKSSYLTDGNFKYDSITIKLIEVFNSLLNYNLMDFISNL
jgi:hypothetical protein